MSIMSFVGIIMVIIGSAISIVCWERPIKPEVDYPAFSFSYEVEGKRHTHICESGYSKVFVNGQPVVTFPVPGKDAQ